MSQRARLWDDGAPYVTNVFTPVTFNHSSFGSLLQNWLTESITLWSRPRFLKHKGSNHLWIIHSVVIILAIKENRGMNREAKPSWDCVQIAEKQWWGYGSTLSLNIRLAAVWMEAGRAGVLFHFALTVADLRKEIHFSKRLKKKKGSICLSLEITSRQPAR